MVSVASSVELSPLTWAASKSPSSSTSTLRSHSSWPPPCSWCLSTPTSSSLGVPAGILLDDILQPQARDLRYLAERRLHLFLPRVPEAVPGVLQHGLLAVRNSIHTITVGVFGGWPEFVG